MRILIFSDLQADDGARRSRLNPDTPLQRWRIERFFREATRVRKEAGCSAVWDLGDTTHNRSQLSLPVLTVTRAGMAALAAGCQRQLNLKLLGNHEQHTRAGAFDTRNLWPEFNAVDGVRVVDLSGIVTSQPCVVVAASFSERADDVDGAVSRALVTARESGCATILIAHLPVRGAIAASGVITDGLSAETAALADVSLFGHIHRRQKLKGGNAWYVGSPFQQDAGEAGDGPKGVCVLDTETLQVSWTDLDFPRYRTVEYPAYAALAGAYAAVGPAALGEDIYRVTIRTPDQMDGFYRLPHAAHADPDYLPGDGARTSPTTDTPGPLNRDDVIAEYRRRAPVPTGLEAAVTTALRDITDAVV